MTSRDFDQIELRSNMRYDVLFDLKLLHEQIQESFPARKKKRLMKQHRTEEKGILGPCILRQLSYFDVGRACLISDHSRNVCYVSGLIMNIDWKNGVLEIVYTNCR
jgi:hypothetical protein